MKWVLDDGPLGLLARFYNPNWKWPGRTFTLAGSVAVGSIQDRSGRRQKLLSLGNPVDPVFSVRHISAASAPGKVLFGYLRTKSTIATRDLGEDESIALCMTELTDGVFVTLDKQAAYLALAELGVGRVVTPFDVWAWLRDQGMVSEQELDELNRATLLQSPLPGVPRRFGSS